MGSKSLGENSVKNKDCICKRMGFIKSDCNGKGETIPEALYEETAKELGIEVAVMKAIAKQESKRDSFWKDNQATILFERHKMYSCYKKVASSNEIFEKNRKENTDIINSSQGGYGKYSEQYDKLERAKKIDYDSAVKASSWGKFQVLGLNYSVLYNSPKEMETAMNKCERQPLLAQVKP